MDEKPHVDPEADERKLHVDAKITEAVQHGTVHVDPKITEAAHEKVTTVPDRGKLTVANPAIRERNLRSEVRARGLTLRKSESPNRRATDYGRYQLVDASTDMIVGRGGRGTWMTLSEVEGWLSTH